MSGHFPIACAGFDRRYDLIGDGLIGVGAGLFGHLVVPFLVRRSRSARVCFRGRVSGGVGGGRIGFAGPRLHRAGRKADERRKLGGRSVPGGEGAKPSVAPPDARLGGRNSICDAHVAELR